MKNQFVGDIGDFAKYGLLRALRGQHEEEVYRLAVVWYLTEDADGAGGGRIEYLTEQIREHYRPCDEDLWDAMEEIVHRGERAVASVHECGILGEDTVFYEAVLHRRNRGDYLDGAAQCIRQAEEDATPKTKIIFLDPDNGLVPPKLPPHRPNGRGADQWVFFDDVRRFWKLGKNLVIYQHPGRNDHEEQIEREMGRLVEALQLGDRCCPFAMWWGGPGSYTPRAFFIVPQAEDRDELVEKARGMLKTRWSDYYRFRDYGG